MVDSNTQNFTPKVMKKSKTIKFGLLNGIIMGLGACASQIAGVDPCMTQTFNAPMCQQALTAHGYYYQGTFFPMMYPYSYGYYNHSYNSYIASGHRVYVAPMSAYARNYSTPESRASGLIGRTEARSGTYLSGKTMGRTFASGRTGGLASRGGFGSIGAGHSSFGG
jgi:hypothetical protein